MSSAAAMRAVNTVVVRNGKWIGYNTDGDGALDAIELTRPDPFEESAPSFSGQAARPKPSLGLRNSAEPIVTIVNRTDQRAQEIAAYLGCDLFPGRSSPLVLTKAQLLLQSTSVGMAPLTDKRWSILYGSPPPPSSLMLSPAPKKPASSAKQKCAAAPS